MLDIFSSLRKSIIILGIIGVFASLLVATGAWWTQQRMSHAAAAAFTAKDAVADILPPPLYLIEMRLMVSQAVEGTLDPAKARAEIQRLAKEYQERVDYWSTHPPYGLERQLLGKQYEAAQIFIRAVRERILDQLQKGNVLAAQQALGAINELYMEHRRSVDETVLTGNALAAQSMAEFEASRTRSVTLTFAAAIAAIALVFVLTLPVLKSIERPIARSAELARRIAGGDLSAVASPESIRTDIIGTLERSLHDMHERLTNIVGEVRRNADGVATASVQIAQGNLDLSQRTERQASSLQQTAASMHQLGNAVMHNADNAKYADELAQGATTVASKGGDVVERVVNTMRGIEDSSRKIVEIISVIDAIAFQTNILALNAAVEAARAGEQGRGFAVVAGEVRTLAQRSAVAAKEIKSLISDSVQRVDDGSKLAHQAGQTMQEVGLAIQHVTNLISDISVASAEQSKGVAQVREAVMQMDQVTQQNAALVEESAAAAESLKLQAQRLVQAVAVFRLAQDGTALV